MATANLNNAPTTFDDGNDSIVIVDNFQSIRGGRTLDVTGFAPDMIRAGHVIIYQTATNQYKPMPVTGANSIGNFGVIQGGQNYTNGTFAAQALTGGTGTGATANITVTDGRVVAVALVNKGTGYANGDVLSAALAGGTGLLIPVNSVAPAGAYAALPAGHVYSGILIATISKLRPFAGIMVRGTINPVAAPYDFATIAGAFKTAVGLIDQRAD